MISGDSFQSTTRLFFSFGSTGGRKDAARADIVNAVHYCSYALFLFTLWKKRSLLSRIQGCEAAWSGALNRLKKGGYCNVLYRGPFISFPFPD